jgi:hypothetical protein
MHSTVSNTSRITIPTGEGGRYLVGGCVNFAGSSSGDMLIRIYLNGSTIISWYRLPNNGSGIAVVMTTNTIYDFSAGDYVELQAQQTSGGSMNSVSTGNFCPEFWAQRLA